MMTSRAERFLCKPTEPPTGTCAWGRCDRSAVTWRWDPGDRQNARDGRWLAVCLPCREAACLASLHTVTR